MIDPTFGIDLDAVRSFLAAKEQRRSAELDARFAQATSDFEAIVGRIVACHEPRRLYQWGSLLDRDKFSKISDIDVAIEGLGGPQEFSALLGDVMGMSNSPLDIVELERVGAENADHIRKQGRLVYERPS